MIEEAEQGKFIMERNHRITGFTIVELLVVIAIIGVLMGLLLPAVQAARESGRRTACMNNLYQLGMAVNRYDQDAGKVPSWANLLSNGNTVSWPVVLLPYIERNDLYESWTSASGGAPSRIAIFVCPSAPPDGTNTGPLAYAGNCGDGGIASNSKYNGVFPSAGVKYSLSDISDGDGTATTLLFAEKCQNSYQSYWGVLVTSFSFQLNDASSTARVPAFGIGTGGGPASQHSPKGAAVAFCDGHTKFLLDGISSVVYDQLVTSRNSKSDYPRALLDESKY